MPSTPKGSEFDRFHASHKFAKYTPAFNSRLEALMGDKSLPLDRRCDACVLRVSYGNHSDFLCVRHSENHKEPMSAADCARRLRLEEFLVHWRKKHPEAQWRARHPEVENWGPLEQEFEALRARADAEPLNVRTIENHFRFEVRAGRMRADGKGMGRILYLLAEPGLPQPEQKPLTPGPSFREIEAAWRQEDPDMAGQFDAAGELRQKVRHLLLQRYREAIRSTTNHEPPPEASEDSPAADAGASEQSPPAPPATESGASEKYPPAPPATAEAHIQRNARALNIKHINTSIVSQSVSQHSDRPTDAGPDVPSPDPDGEERMRTLLLHELGERYPGETPGRTLCLQIVQVLADADWDHLRAKLRSHKWKRGDSMGLALPLAREVRERWMMDAPKREREQQIAAAEAAIAEKQAKQFQSEEAARQRGEEVWVSMAEADRAERVAKTVSELQPQQGHRISAEQLAHNAEDLARWRFVQEYVAKESQPEDG